MKEHLSYAIKDTVNGLNWSDISIEEEEQSLEEYKLLLESHLCLGLNVCNAELNDERNI